MEAEDGQSNKSFDDAIPKGNGQNDYRPFSNSKVYKLKYAKRAKNLTTNIKQRTYSYAKKLRTSALLLWDGLIFFGFDDTKIRRLKQLDGENKE